MKPLAGLVLSLGITLAPSMLRAQDAWPARHRHSNNIARAQWQRRRASEAAITVTTLVELEAKLLAAAITEANFARAKSDLRLANVLQNGRGSLEDCAVFLSDDGRSALAFAFWNDDTKTICASFELGRPASESEFDHNTWTAGLMQGDEWPTM
jgi:hypothetical protein